MKVQTNLRECDVDRLRQTLVTGETIAGFAASAIRREITRREKGGKVVVEKRPAGRPKST